MIGRSVARRYLSAAMGAADRGGLREPLGRQLEMLAETLGAAEQLGRLLKHPGLDIERKLEAVEGVIGEAPVEPMADLIELLVENGRVEILYVAGEVYQELIDEDEGVLRAFVSTPMPLAHDQAERLKEALSSWMGTDVVLDARIAPETIGGIAVRVGDRVLDASLRGRLDRIKKTISEN